MSAVTFVDLSRVDSPGRDESADLCIIGAGAAGIYLADRMAAGGADVIVVEAGGGVCGDCSAVGFDANLLGEPYLGATQGREFGLGGSTSRWGGLLLPYTRHDLRHPNDSQADIWSQIVMDVGAHSSQVLARLGYEKPGRFFEFAREELGPLGQSLQAVGLAAAASLFLPVQRKNLSFLLNRKERSAGNGRIRVFLNAVAKTWELGSALNHPAADIRRVSAVSGCGKNLQVSAKFFVIAAGAIESARILLELNAGSAMAVLPASAAVGCYLADHLSIPIADVAAESRADAVRLFAPRFCGDWMRTLRFIEESPPADAPRAFAHFIFDNENPGFALAKEVLGALQGRRRAQIPPRLIAKGVGGLVALGYTRYLHSRLYVPSNTPSRLQLDVEQMPLRENRVSLGSKQDRYCRRVAEIQWRISEADLSTIQETSGRILKRWPGAKAGLPDLLPRQAARIDEKPHDAYHPVGTCRMGSDPEAVVGLDLRVAGTRNLWVVSTGVFPSAGTANPTFSMLCLAEGLAHRLPRST